MKRLITCFLSFACMAALLTGCAYHLQSVSRDTLPGGVDSIALTRVVNPSLETWIEPRVRTALSEELQKRAQVQVVDMSRAQGWLEVKILTYSSGVKVENAQEETVKSAVSLTVQARLIRADDRELLWQSSPVFVQESFVNQGGQNSALLAGGRAVDLVMERIVDQLCQAF